MKTALIIGSTGLVGHQLLQMLLHSQDYHRVISFVRKPTGVHHQKLVEKVIDFDKPETFESLVQGEDFFCALGTTIQKAKSKEAFEKVDLVYPKRFAQIAFKNGIKQFLIISSMGADINSSTFYLRTKGKIENELKSIGFEGVTIVRPSILTGVRHEFRLGERIGIAVMMLVSPLFFGALKKYEPIQGKTVAEAMVAIAKKKIKGFHVYESDAIKQIAANENHLPA